MELAVSKKKLFVASAKTYLGTSPEWPPHRSEYGGRNSINVAASAMATERTTNMKV